MDSTQRDALLRACQIKGQAYLASRIGVSPQRLNNWLRRKLPDGMVLPVSRATDQVVTPHELCPRMYPHPADGLDPNYRPPLPAADPSDHHNSAQQRAEAA